MSFFILKSNKHIHLGFIMESFSSKVLEKITMKKCTKFQSSAIIRFKVIAVLGGVLVSKSQKCKSSHCSLGGTHKLYRFMNYDDYGPAGVWGN